MEKYYHSITIVIYDREKVYEQVSKHLHNYAESIILRVGYPVKHKNLTIIFLIIEMTNDELGAFSGKLGQISEVKVKSSFIKI